MSTRGLYGLRYRNEDKTTYSPSDSYPDYLGAIFVEWLSKKSVEELKEIFDNTEMVTEGELTELDKRWCLNHGITPQENWSSTLSDCFGDPSAFGISPVLLDSSEYILDSLFCEYAYIANLDTNQLEFWVGFQTSPDPDNRYGTKKSASGYYPCKLIKTWPLNDDIWKNPADITTEMEAIRESEEDD